MKKTTASVLLILLAVNFVNIFRNSRPSVLLTTRNGEDECDNLSCVCSNWNTAMTKEWFIAPGPSHLHKIIPMSTLKEQVFFNSTNGLKYLDHISLSRYYQCNVSARDHQWLKKFHWCSERKFVQKKSPMVALVSFHGSGNTWLRYLIEQSTGIFTGSVYCDQTLKSVFPGESVVSANVIVIKTHFADSTELPKDIQLVSKKMQYDKAIILVRDPYDALLSEANRRWSSKSALNSHIGLASEKDFIGNSKWDWLVEYKGAVWAYLIHTWLSQNDTEVLVVQYEKLVVNLKDELRRILAFLDIKMSEETEDCVLSNNNGIFKRSHHLDFNPYSKENIKTLNSHMIKALPLLVKYNITYKIR